MSSRNFAQVPPTAATIALNAYIYGYGGHSLVTPHQALKRLWWTDERIDARITRAFVISKLRGEERDFLDRPLAFGEGLTDDSYMEWILDRAKRLFLILTQIGVPDQIFGCIDDSWDDNDLPIPLDNIKSLELSYDNDEALNKRFYDMQFLYLLRELKKGSHIDYGPKEHIPMEHVNTLPPATTLQPYDRVHFPNRPDEVFMRRKFSVTDKDTGQFMGESFTRDIRRARTLAHEHVASTWATYTSENAAYILSDFVPEHTLATFIEHRTPASYVKTRPTERPLLVAEWMHCLADALASLHHRGVAHTAIRPSNIWIDNHNHIAFSDVASIPTYQRNKKVPKSEIYDYAAPESQTSRSPVVIRTGGSPSSPPISSMNAFAKLRKLSTHSDYSSISGASSSASSSSGGSSTRSNSFVNIAGTSPVTPPSTSARSSSLSSSSTAVSPTLSSVRSPRSFRNFSRRLVHPNKPSTSSTTSDRFSSITSPLTVQDCPSRLSDPTALRNLPAATPEMSDVYSLGCVYLDLLTFLLRGKTTEFHKFRTTRVSHHRQKDTKSTKSSLSSTGPTAATLPPSKTDSSFHAHPDQLTTWLDTLSAEACATVKISATVSEMGPSPVLSRGVPRLLDLIRAMLAQNATLRPTAMGIKETIEQVLEECGVKGEMLCCWDRGWEVSEEVDTEIGQARGSGERCATFAGQAVESEKPEQSKKKTAAPKTRKEKKQKMSKSSRRTSDALSEVSGVGQKTDMAVLQRLGAISPPPLTPVTALSPPPLFSKTFSLGSPTPSESRPPPSPGPPPKCLPPPLPSPSKSADVSETSPHRPAPCVADPDAANEISTKPSRSPIPTQNSSQRRPSMPVSTPQLPPISPIPPLSAFPAMSVPPSTSSMLIQRHVPSPVTRAAVPTTKGEQPSTDFGTMALPKGINDRASIRSADPVSARPASRRESNTSTLMAVGKWNAWKDRLFSI